MLRRFFAILLFFVCVQAAAARADSFASQFNRADPPAALPPLTFEDNQGRTIDLKHFRGHYLLLNLWASWCGPCIREMGSLDALQAHFDAKTLSVVPLTEDRDGHDAASGFYKRHGLSHLQIFVDKGGVAPFALHARGLPTTLLIDPNGMEIGRVEGDAVWDDPDTIAFLKAQMQAVTPHPHPALPGLTK